MEACSNTNIVHPEDAFAKFKPNKPYIAKSYVIAVVVIVDSVALVTLQRVGKIDYCHEKEKGDRNYKVLKYFALKIYELTIN